MESTAKIFIIGERREGISERGSWKRQEIVVETLEQYPTKMALQIWGDDVDVVDHLRQGDIIIFSWRVESREFNGKWYTDIRASRLRSAQPVQALQPQYQAPVQPQIPPQQPMFNGGWPEPNPLQY